MSVRGQGLCISVIQGEMKVSGIENLAQCKCGSYATHIIVCSYFMPVCSIVKTITPRCCGPSDALLHEAEGRVQ